MGGSQSAVPPEDSCAVNCIKLFVEKKQKQLQLINDAKEIEMEMFKRHREELQNEEKVICEKKMCELKEFKKHQEDKKKQLQLEQDTYQQEVQKIMLQLEQDEIELGKYLSDQNVNYDKKIKEMEELLAKSIQELEDKLKSEKEINQENVKIIEGLSNTLNQQDPLKLEESIQEVIKENQTLEGKLQAAKETYEKDLNSLQAELSRQEERVNQMEQTYRRIDDDDNDKEEIKRNDDIINKVLTGKIFDLNVIASYEEVLEDTEEYQTISNELQEATMHHWQLKSVTRIYNPFLQALFLLKQAQIEEKYGQSGCNIKTLYQGVRAHQSGYICRNNFSVRKLPNFAYKRFGNGVHLTTKMSSAIHSCDRNINEKIIIIFQAICGASQIGDTNMQIPAEGYLCTRNNQKTTFVFYDDNMFVPVFKIVVKEPQIGGLYETDVFYRLKNC